MDTFKTILVRVILLPIAGLFVSRTALALAHYNGWYPEIQAAEFIMTAPTMLQIESVEWGLLAALTLGLWGLADYVFYRRKPRSTAQAISAGDHTATQSPSIPVENTWLSVLDLFDLAEKQYGWNFKDPSVQILDFIYGLRQAGLHKTVILWGKINHGDKHESLTRDEPMKVINKAHWDSYELDIFKAIHENNNLYIWTQDKRQLGSNPSRGGYADIHVTRDTAIRWLQNVAPKFKGHNKSPTLFNEESKRLSGVVHAMMEYACRWDFKLPLPQGEKFVSQYEEIERSPHPIWTNAEINQLRRDFLNLCGRAGQSDDLTEARQAKSELRNTGASLIARLLGEKVT